MANMALSSLVGFADIDAQALEDWREYKVEGRQYLQLADNAFRKKKKMFTNEILYNLIAMAIEKLVMSALMEIGRLPYNHTMHDLAASLEQWMPETIQGMKEAISQLDNYQDICDPYACSIKIPTVEEIETMLGLARRLEQRLHSATA